MSAIPSPRPEDMGAEYVGEHRANMAALDADPRTAGNARRPPWLVRQVLYLAALEAQRATEIARDPSAARKAAARAASIFFAMPPVEQRDASIAARARGLA